MTQFENGGGGDPGGGFSGGSVVKNPLANAGDMGLIRGMGRSHMLKEGFTRLQ